MRAEYLYAILRSARRITKYHWNKDKQNQRMLRRKLLWSDPHAEMNH